MNDMMRIILLSPSEAAFDPTPAIEHWYGALQRRQCCRRSAPQDVDSDKECPSLASMLQDVAAVRNSMSCVVQ